MLSSYLSRDACPCANILKRILIFDLEYYPLGGRGYGPFHRYRACKFWWWGWRVQLFSQSPMWCCGGCCPFSVIWHMHWVWSPYSSHSVYWCHCCAGCIWSSLGCKYNQCMFPYGWYQSWSQLPCTPGYQPCSQYQGKPCRCQVCSEAYMSMHRFGLLLHCCCCCHLRACCYV